MRNRTIIVLFVLSAALSCISKQRPNKEMSKNNLNISYNEINTISGVYAKGILSQREEGDHMGHYKIIVNDTLEITLLPPYSKEAKRSTEEVERMEGRYVKVTGIVSKRTYLSESSINSQSLSVNIPCFITIDLIELID